MAFREFVGSTMSRVRHLEQLERKYQADTYFPRGDWQDVREILDAAGNNVVGVCGIARMFNGFVDRELAEKLGVVPTGYLEMGTEWQSCSTSRLSSRWMDDWRPTVEFGLRRVGDYFDESEKLGDLQASAWKAKVCHADLHDIAIKTWVNELDEVGSLSAAEMRHIASLVKSYCVGAFAISARRVDVIFDREQVRGFYGTGAIG